MQCLAIFAAVVALTVSECSGESLVPLLAVSNCQALPSTHVSNGDVHTILSQVDIEELDVAIVMNAEQLSFDDMVRYGGVYGEKNAPLSTLQEILSSSESSLSAGVSGQSASDLTSLLSFAMDTKPTTIKAMSQLPVFGGSGQHLVVLELPRGTDKDETFRMHDSILAELKDYLDHSAMKYAIFYTSDHSSTRKPALTKSTSLKQYSHQVSSYSGRPKCFEVKDEHNYTSCILFCFTNPFVIYTSDNQTTVLGNGEEGIRFERGSCNSTESLPEEYQTNTTFAFIMFNMEGNASATEGEPPLRRKLVFAFENGSCNTEADDGDIDKVGCGFWTMKIFAGENPKELAEFRRDRPDGNIFTTFSVPRGASYSCGNCSLNKFVSVSSAASNDSYQLGGIQVQAFAKAVANDNNELVFGAAYQCQGYIGSASWMGVISTILLIVILYISYVFAFTLQSPDTFDDPRYPTITVENLN